MRALAVVFALLVAAAVGWLTLGERDDTPPVAPPQPPASPQANVDPAAPAGSRVEAPSSAPSTSTPPAPAASGTEAPAPVPAAGTVVLHVRDAANRAAVPSFRWRFRPREQGRGEDREQRGNGTDGRAELDLPAGARGELLVEATDFAPFEQKDLMAPAAGEPPLPVDAFLEPAVVAAGITLLVHDTARHAVTNVRVDAFSLTPESRDGAWHLGRSLWARRTSAADGRYVLPPLPPGEYGIRVVATDAEGGLLPLLPYSHTFALTGGNGFVEDVTLEPGCLPVFELVDTAGAFVDPTRFGTVTLALRWPGGPAVSRRWTTVSGTAAATAVDTLPGAAAVWPAEALPAGAYTFEVFVAGDPRVQRSVTLRAGERQVERVVVP